MAELNILSWDSEYEVEGAARVLRDGSDLHIKDAKKVIKDVMSGRQRTIQVPFAKKELVRNALALRGFKTS